MNRLTSHKPPGCRTEAQEIDKMADEFIERTLTEEVSEITKDADTWKECVRRVNRHQKNMWTDLAAEMNDEQSDK
jgi:hydrogenase maturation factor HypF (carbamoyltransferase family)